MQSLSALRIFAVFARGPRMRIDDPSVTYGIFVARVSTVVTTIDRRPGRGKVFPAGDIALALVFAVPSEGGKGSAETSAAVRRLATRHLRRPCRPWAVFPQGSADEQPLPLALSRLMLTMASGPAGPNVHPRGVLTPVRESHARDRLWPSLRPLLLPPGLP